MRIDGYRRVVLVAGVLAVLLAACAGTPADDAPSADATPAEDGPGPTDDEPADDGEPTGEPASEAVMRETWRPVGIVIPMEPYDGLSDIKVGRFGDGTYLAEAATGESRQVAFRSNDLVEWEFIHMHPLGHFELPGAYITLDDGGLRKFWVSDQPIAGGTFGIVSATTTDGITWQRDPGARLTEADVDGDVRFHFLSIVPRDDGGWRMYVQLADCSITNLYGEPNCEPSAHADDGGCGCSLHSIYSAVSDDMMEWTVEPGLRFEASWENGSFHQINAWIHPDGTVRIGSQMEVPPQRADEEWDPHAAIFYAYNGTIVSDDGLEFHTYLEHRLRGADDPFVVEAPDGGVVMFGGGGGSGPIGEHDGIRMWEPVTVTWAFDELAFVEDFVDVPGWEEGPDLPAQGRCFEIRARGDGRFTFDVRGSIHPFQAASAEPHLHAMEPEVLEASGTGYLVTREDYGEFHTNPYHLVAVDEDGVHEWLQISAVPELVPGGSCRGG